MELVICPIIQQNVSLMVVIVFECHALSICIDRYINIYINKKDDSLTRSKKELRCGDSPYAHITNTVTSSLAQIGRHCINTSSMQFGF
mmetsp:Transcript_22127/g.33119  ORF Transcript_22127/g.33119 Transcript_22127/m.33119 type:complete len:88 (+) Transcript_22127:1208-1471(+)